MKKLTKIRIFLSTCLVALAAVFCGVLISSVSPVAADAETALSGYKTDGSSVRIYELDDEGNYKDTTRKGIRFHVEMPMDSKLNGVALIPDVSVTNERNGSFKLAEGFKTYTLIIPTSMLSGELKVDTENVMKLNTTEYWFKDKDGNAESVAYVYGLPKTQYTTNLSFRGVICSVAEDGTETVIASTDISERCMAYVAKRAYEDTTDENSDYWGSAEQDKDAATKIKNYIPIYNITYDANGEKTTEEVMWGDAPTSAPTGDFNTWYDENASAEVDVTQKMTYATSQNITLTSTNAYKFTLTGVEYTEGGFNVFATLPTENFKNGTVLKPETINMQKSDGTKVPVKEGASIIVGGGDGKDAISKIAISFDHTSISNGDTLTILKTSHFYNNGTLYELEKDYEFVYSDAKWQLPLGYITLGDIEKIENYTEKDSNGGDEHNIRVTFRSDFLVNGNATLSGNVYVKRADGETVETIPDGYYYWNQGNNKILELPGEKDLWGEKDGDVLTIEANTRLVQNNGFYVFQETIEAEFDGAKNWVFKPEEHEIDASAFTGAYTRQADGKIYIDVYTAIQWTDHYVKVVCNNGTLTYHDTDNVTTLDPNEIFYHGENGNYILRIYIDRFSVTGDWVTIPAGTDFWVGNQIYKLTEDVISYFVDTTGTGLTWVTNPTITEIDHSNIDTVYWEAGNIRYKTSTVWATAGNNKVVVDDTYIDGDGVICEGATYTKFFYYGGTNSLLELQGVNFGEEGGSVTIKAGTILWLFNNSGNSYTGAYKLTEDITISVSGSAGSLIKHDKEVLSVNKNSFVSIGNDGSHGGEIRLWMNSVAITGTYDAGTVEGSVTLNGKPTTTAFVYGGDGTSKYNGNTIISFTGEGFGGAFQATAAGDRIKIADGTKIWLSNGLGYIYVEGDIEYVYNGSEYISADTQYTVLFTAINATVTVNNVPVTSTAVNVGDGVTFSVAVNDECLLLGVEGAVNNGDGTYTVNVYANTTVTVTAAKYINLTSDSISRVEVYNHDSVGYRLYLVQTDEINAIMGGNYGIVYSEAVSLKLGGAETNPTQYNYFGLIEENNFQILEFICDVTKLTYGDTIYIKQGTVFTVGTALLRVQEDIQFIYTQGGNLIKYKDQKLETTAFDKLHNVYNDESEIRIVINDQSETHYGFTYFEGTMTCGSKTYSSVYVYGGNSNEYKGYTIIGFRGVTMEAGETITIAKGSKFYLPTGYYELETEIKILYNGNGWSIVS